MKLRQIGEFGLIERVCRTFPNGRGVRIGIGDDAAWVHDKFGSFLVTADLLIEGIHFDLKWISLFALGYKTLAVNLSDIAAMGGVPSYLLLSLGIPPDFAISDIDEFYRGIHALASESRVALVGGDTSIAHSLLISACIIGGTPYKPVTRRGAKTGHDIYVTGTLGDSALGLELLKKGVPRKSEAAQFLVSRHHQPTARLKIGGLLASQQLTTAMIDISDGLVQDLGHICKASGVGAVVWEEHLPLSAAYRKFAGNNRATYALAGGEDYELLFCARRRDRQRIAQIGRRTHTPVTRIGTCTSSGDGVRVIDESGKPVVTRLQGYDHFKSTRRSRTTGHGPAPLLNR